MLICVKRWSRSTQYVAYCMFWRTLFTVRHFQRLDLLHSQSKLSSSQELPRELPEDQAEMKQNDQEIVHVSMWCSFSLCRPEQPCRNWKLNAFTCKQISPPSQRYFSLSEPLAGQVLMSTFAAFRSVQLAGRGGSHNRTEYWTIPSKAIFIEAHWWGSCSGMYLHIFLCS